MHFGNDWKDQAASRLIAAATEKAAEFSSDVVQKVIDDYSAQYDSELPGLLEPAETASNERQSLADQADELRPPRPKLSPVSMSSDWHVIGELTEEEFVTKEQEARESIDEDALEGARSEMAIIDELLSAVGDVQTRLLLCSANRLLWLSLLPNLNRLQPRWPPKSRWTLLMKWPLRLMMRWGKRPTPRVASKRTRSGRWSPRPMMTYRWDQAAPLDEANMESLDAQSSADSEVVESSVETSSEAVVDLGDGSSAELALVADSGPGPRLLVTMPGSPGPETYLHWRCHEPWLWPQQRHSDQE